MFTGVVQGVGKIEKITNTLNRSSRKISVNLGRFSKGLRIGQSVSLNGVCLSVVKISNRVCNFEMIGETIRKTSLGNLKPGDIVNIERSLKAGERLEGHFVLGHVDGIGVITKIEKKSNEIKVWVGIPKNIMKHVVKKGSIAIDGISLTVVDVKNNKLSVCLIPHTIKTTNFSVKKIGDKVNIETDILGKYIIK